MPSYPPAPATLSGDLLTIHRLLQSPTLLSRALRSVMDLRFVSDQLLTGKYRSTGGAVMYEISEPILNARTVTAVAAGSEYPMDSTLTGTAALAAVSKWGQKVFLSDERIKRSVYAGNEAARQLQKAVNTVVNKVEQIAIATIGSQVTATSGAAAAWSAGGALIYRDIEKAAATIVDLNQAYNPDTVLMSTTKYAYAISDQIIAGMRRRETTENPIYGGTLTNIGQYKVVYTALANLPSDDVWVLDSSQLGAMVDETNADPGYVNVEHGIQVQSHRLAGRDGWDLWARRLTVPIVQEPGAAVRITGTT